MTSPSARQGPPRKTAAALKILGVVRRFVESQNGTLEAEFSEVESGKWTDDERPQLAAALEYAKRTKGTVVIA